MGSNRTVRDPRNDLIVPAFSFEAIFPRSHAARRLLWGFAVFQLVADVVEVKTGSRSTGHWWNDSIWLNRWPRNSLAQLITLLDIDGICQNREDSNIANLQNMAVAERREAEPTTQHRNEVGLAIRQGTIVLLAESCRQ